MSQRELEFRWEDAVTRIHILSLVMDLCDLRAVRKVAHTLCNGTVSNPPGLDGEYLLDVRIPKLDSVIFNAAYGGWSGFSMPGAIWSILTKGLTQSVTWPEFKQALPTRILNEEPGYNYVRSP
jgi:3-keto steroid reductase